MNKFSRETRPPIPIHLTIINLTLNEVLIEIASTIYYSKRPSDCSKKHKFWARECESLNLFFSIFSTPFFPFQTFTNYWRAQDLRFTCYATKYKYILHTMQCKYFIQTGKLRFNLFTRWDYKKRIYVLRFFLTDHIVFTRKKWKMENQYTFISSHENW